MELWTRLLISKSNMAEILKNSIDHLTDLEGQLAEARRIYLQAMDDGESAEDLRQQVENLERQIKELTGQSV